MKNHSQDLGKVRAVLPGRQSGFLLTRHGSGGKATWMMPFSTRVL